MWSKNRSELAKTWFRPRPVQRLKKTTVSVFFSPGPVFFSFRKCLDWSRSQSCFFGPKNQTGPDFWALGLPALQSTLLQSSHGFLQYLFTLLPSQWVTFWPKAFSSLLGKKNCNLQWGTKPFKCFVMLECFFNNLWTTWANQFKSCTVVEYHVTHKYQLKLLHNIYSFSQY